MIALCIPIRLYALPKIFTEDELILIDSDPKTVKTWIAHHEEEEHEEELEHLIDDSDTKIHREMNPKMEILSLSLLELRRRLHLEEGERRRCHVPMEH